MATDLTPLYFNRGELVEILKSENPSILTPFSSFSACEYNIIISCIQNFCSISSGNENLKSKILLCCAHISSGNRHLAVEILDGIGKLNIDDFDGWLKDYFLSTYNFLVMALSQSPILKNGSPKKVAMIGDSHILGMGSCYFPYSDNLNLFYIPGLRLSLISPSLHNIKKEALRNFFFNSYSSDILVFSIGEIDTRAIENKANNIEVSFLRLLNYTKSFVQELKSFVGIEQKLVWIMPPKPKTIVINKNKIYLNFYKKYINDATQLCSKNGVTVIQYPDIQKNDYVDHGHFSQSIYISVLEKIEKL